MSEQENNILEQQIESGNQTAEQVDNTAYIEAIKEMKRNSVDKKTHQAVLTERDSLLKALMNGETIEVEERNPKDLKEIMDRFRNAETTLDGVSAALEYRDEIMKRGGDDPFLPGGDRVKKIIPTDEDKATANRVAEGFRHCVEYAEGDPVIFANELSRITIDSAPMAVRKKR